MQNDQLVRVFSEDALAELRERVLPTLSLKRYRHVAAVEDMAAKLADLYCPERRSLLRAAALLHDITKEWSVEDHCQFLLLHRETVTGQDILAHKTLHARTAAILIPEQYPGFADPELISDVRWHTTGRAGMTLSERLLYLADYIDLSRTFPDCVALRGAFLGADPEHLDPAGRSRLLLDTLIQSFDMTISGLCRDGLPIASETVEARNSLIMERSDKTNN